MPCLPLRSDHPCSSSVVKEPSDLENQIGRLYFRSDPVKYCKKKADVRPMHLVQELSTMNMLSWH
jgi:hypothetical protein